MNYTINDVLKIASQDNINLTSKQAADLLSGKKICGVFYCITWSNEEGRIYIIAKPPEFKLKPIADIKKDVEKSKKKKDSENDSTVLKGLLSLYSLEQLELLLEVARMADGLDINDGRLEKSCMEVINEMNPSSPSPPKNKL